MKVAKKNELIQVKNLVKRYRGSESNAVDGVSFYVEEGSFFSLLGPNGAGKTTTISIVTTTLSPSSGQVKICGFDISKEPEKVRERIGVIFQNPSIDQNLTAEENIRFHANLYGLYRYRPVFSWMNSEYKKKVDELAQILGLEGKMHLKVKEFSGGMKRKLEIIRSLMHKPKVLFLDEPTTGLDPTSRRNLWEYLQTMKKKHKTTIFLTTHYLEEAEAADYVCIINNGKVVSRGTPDEIKEDLVDEFVVIDAKDRRKLLVELKTKKWKISGDGPVKVELNGHNAANIVQNIKTPLSRLAVNKPTLEQAYIQIIGQGN